MNVVVLDAMRAYDMGTILSTLLHRKGGLALRAIGHARPVFVLDADIKNSTGSGSPTIVTCSPVHRVRIAEHGFDGADFPAAAGRWC